MAEIKWTSQAADDLQTIVDFIASDSPPYASLFAIDVIAAVARLGDFPQSGRTVPEFSDRTIREIILGNYRIVYRVNDDIIVILTIHHSARLMDPGRIHGE